MAVRHSKKLASRRSMCGRRVSVHCAKASSVIGTPSTRMRSVAETRWGDVYRPTLKPRARRSAVRKAQVLPFPFVPPTWMLG
jgi:hypothetical protein